MRNVVTSGMDTRLPAIAAGRRRQPRRRTRGASVSPKPFTSVSTATLGLTWDDVDYD